MLRATLLAAFVPTLGLTSMLATAGEAPEKRPSTRAATMTVSVTVLPSCKLGWSPGSADAAPSAQLACGSDVAPRIRVQSVPGSAAVYEGASLEAAMLAVKRVGTPNGEPAVVVVDF